MLSFAMKPRHASRYGSLSGNDGYVALYGVEGSSPGLQAAESVLFPEVLEGITTYLDEERPEEILGFELHSRDKSEKIGQCVGGLSRLFLIQGPAEIIESIDVTWGGETVRHVTKLKVRPRDPT